MQSRFSRDETESIHDIWDGEEYRKHSRPGGFLSSTYPANVSFIMNTDGVSIFHSSKVSYIDNVAFVWLHIYLSLSRFHYGQFGLQLMNCHQNFGFQKRIFCLLAYGTLLKSPL